MLEGKRFFPETGIPILKMARRMVLLAVELPDPFLVPTMIEKSFITLSMVLLVYYSGVRQLADENVERAPQLQSLRPVVQEISMGDESVIPSLDIIPANRFNHFLVIFPDFL